MSSFVHYKPCPVPSTSRAPPMTALAPSLHARTCGAPCRRCAAPSLTARAPTSNPGHATRRNKFHGLHAYLGDESIVRLDEGYQLPTTNLNGPVVRSPVCMKMIGMLRACSSVRLDWDLFISCISARGVASATLVWLMHSQQTGLPFQGNADGGLQPRGTGRPESLVDRARGSHGGAHRGHRPYAGHALVASVQDWRGAV